jgi:hypothetical protein
VSRDITAGFTRIDLKGSRHRDVALVFCAFALASVMVLQPAGHSRRRLHCVAADWLCIVSRAAAARAPLHAG